MNTLPAIMHIDANSAYLSWTATELLKRGHPEDIRELPAVIAGDPQTRQGIILAKSIKAKAKGISTGVSLMEAKKLCPGLQVFPPDYDLYLKSSEAMHNILAEYSPTIERYSIDESWIDFTGCESLFGDPVELAYQIKDRIKTELGFTVNVGVSVNKLLAKMGSEMRKPDMVHTLFPSQIEEKMWPLPASELFFVGRATSRKLREVGITTIGQIAKTDVNVLKSLLKPVHGQLVHDYANGIDSSPVTPNNTIVQKGLGNSTTIPYDVTNTEEAFKVLLALSERVGTRLRKLHCFAGVVSVTIRNSDLFFYRHQRKLTGKVGTTTELYDLVCSIFKEMWHGDAIRQLGVHLSDLSSDSMKQLSFDDRDDEERLLKIDQTVDTIRSKYGDSAVMRGVFANSGIQGIQGGVNDGNYLMMGGHSI
jgi:DNA polymerase-4